MSLSRYSRALYHERSSYFTLDILMGNEDVQEINQSRKYWGEFHTLYEGLRSHPTKFFEYTRMSTETFDYILEAIREDLKKCDTNFQNAIAPKEKLFITLRFLSTGMAFRSLAFTFRMGKTTVADIVYETCISIWNRLVEIHMPKLSQEQLKQVAQEYYDKWQFPNCIGSIDGKHCRIKRPANSGSDYHNYRKFFSIVLQAVADAKKRFITVEVGGKGKQSDGGTFQYSALNQLLTSNRYNIPPPQRLPGTNYILPMVLIGDEAYPLKDFLMRPFPDRVLNESRDIFNKRLSRARKCIECAFGILCAKWRILNKPIETNTKHACLIIKTACLLHNIIIDKEGIQDSSAANTYNHDLFDNHNRSQPGRQNNSSSLQARMIREAFMQYFCDT